MGFTTIDINKFREDVNKIHVEKEREEPKPPFPFTGFHNCIFNLTDVRGVYVSTFPKYIVDLNDYREGYCVRIIYNDGSSHRISPGFETKEDANDYMLKAWGIILETLEEY